MEAEKRKQKINQLDRRAFFVDFITMVEQAFRFVLTASVVRVLRVGFRLSLAPNLDRCEAL